MKNLWFFLGINISAFIIFGISMGTSSSIVVPIIATLMLISILGYTAYRFVLLPLWLWFRGLPQRATPTINSPTTKKILLGVGVFLISLWILGQCTSDTSTNDSLVNIEVDEPEKSEVELVELIKKSVIEKKHRNVKKFVNQLTTKYPESGHIAQYKKTMLEIDAKIEKQAQDSIKLANINNLGIWHVGYYVDDFGEPTNQGYIRTNTNGTFSNTATQDSNLNVRFLISNESDISIMLFEYAGNNPVKGYKDRYRITVLDKDKKRHQFGSSNYDSDRLTVDTSDAKKLSNVLKTGGEIKFLIVDTKRSSTRYSFTIENADWYENALTKLKAKK